MRGNNIGIIALLIWSSLTAQLAEADSVLGYTLEYQGAFYAITVNENGAILQSGKETIYLGINCDVLTDTGVRGYWSWSNAGFGLSLPDRTMSFERADAPVKDLGKCAE